MKLILSSVLAIGIVVPTAASASVLRTSLVAGDEGSLIKIDDRGKHRGKGKHRGRDDFDYDDRDDRRDERRAYRQGLRDGRREARGQYYQPGYRDDHRRYGRGQHLPAHYRSQVINDYARYGYPPPPRGCRYVRVGQDTYLTQMATGLILNAFLGGGY